MDRFLKKKLKRKKSLQRKRQKEASRKVEPEQRNGFVLDDILVSAFESLPPPSDDCTLVRELLSKDILEIGFNPSCYEHTMLNVARVYGLYLTWSETKSSYIDVKKWTEKTLLLTREPRFLRQCESCYRELFGQV